MAGRVKTPGLVEVPMGTPLRQIVFDLAGGIRDGREFKAARPAAPPAAASPSSFWTCPWIMTASRSRRPSWAPAAWSSWTSLAAWWTWPAISCTSPHDESCGKCTPCREGTKHLLEILTEITQGEGQEEHLALMEELCATMAPPPSAAWGRAPSTRCSAP